jgi:hypothetical protein
MLRRLAGSLWIRALVSAGLLALVLSHIDFAKVGGRLSAGRWDVVAAAVAALFVSFLVAGVRWLVFPDCGRGGTPRTRNDPRVSDRSVHEQLLAKSIRR